jgi:hypothetical protein
MAYETVKMSERYMTEIDTVADMAREAFEEHAVEAIAMTDAGVDTLTGDAATIKNDIFDSRLADGYELSYSQMCNGIYRAARELGILSDERTR